MSPIEDMVESNQNDLSTGYPAQSKSTETDKKMVVIFKLIFELILSYRFYTEDVTV